MNTKVINKEIEKDPKTTKTKITRTPKENLTSFISMNGGFFLD